MNGLFQYEPKICSKGKHGVSMYTRKDGFTKHHSADEVPSTADAQSSQASVAGKPWKRHGNRGRRQKLRRVYKDLDIHSPN